MATTNNDSESGETDGNGWNMDVLRADYEAPRQSDIAFLWDAVNCNPNGDPLSGDEPRRDPITGEAQVSMYRIKRYLRDQMHDDHRGEPEDILVKRPDQAGRQNPLDRPAAYRLIDDAIAESMGFDALDLTGDDDDGDTDVSLAEYLRAFLDSATDVRAFGAPISIADNDGDDIAAIRSALPRRITGPVQIHWAVSFNATATLTEGRKITTVFSSGSDDEDDEKEQGTFGEDHRLKYAVFGVNATIDENTAQETRFSNEDAAYLDTAFWRAFKNQTLTHSKVGQEPRLYVRIEYDDGSQVGDLKRRFDVVNRDHRDDRELRSIEDWYLDARGFLKVIDHESIRDRIADVHLVVSEQLDVSVDGDDPGKYAGPEAFVNAVSERVGDRLDASIRI